MQIQSINMAIVELTFRLNYKKNAYEPHIFKYILENYIICSQEINVKNTHRLQ